MVPIRSDLANQSTRARITGAHLVRTTSTAEGCPLPMNSCSGVQSANTGIRGILLATL